MNVNSTIILNISDGLPARKQPCAALVNDSNIATHKCQTNQRLPFLNSSSTFIHTVLKGQLLTSCQFSCLFYPLDLNHASSNWKIVISIEIPLRNTNDSHEWTQKRVKNIFFIFRCEKAYYRGKKAEKKWKNTKEPCKRTTS